MTFSQWAIFEKVFLTPFHYVRTPAKPLALSQDEILTNSGAWRLKLTAAGQKVSIEKLSLPTDLKLNSVESAKLMTIKQVLKKFL